MLNMVYRQCSSQRVLLLPLLLLTAYFASAGCITRPAPGGTLYSAPMGSPYMITGLQLTTDGTCGTGLTWTVTSGTLPVGMSLSSGGLITGTPTTLGAKSFTVSVTGSSGSDSKATGITVVGACAITNTVPLPKAPLTDTYPSWDDTYRPWTSLLTSGTCDPANSGVTFTVSAGSLPSGLAITYDSTYKKYYITGTSTAALGTSSFTLQASGSAAIVTQANSIQTVQANPTFLPALHGYAAGAQGMSTLNYEQFTTPQTVSMAASSGATICYTLNFQSTDTEPTTNGAGTCTGATLTYSAPILIGDSTLIRAVATKSGVSDSNIAPGYYDIILAGDPIPPQTYIKSTINSTNFPCLFTSPVIKTVKASGGDYTSVQAAWAAVPFDTTGGTNCEIIEVDSASTGFVTNLAPGVTLKYQAHMNADKYMWTRPSAYSSLPAQDSETHQCPTPDGNTVGCTIDDSDRPNMWKAVKTTSCSTVTDPTFGTVCNPYNYDNAALICGDHSGYVACPDGAAASGLLISGGDFEYRPEVTGLPYHNYLFNYFIIGDVLNTLAGMPSRIYFDRDMFRTVSGAFDMYLRGDIAGNEVNTISVTDTNFRYGFEPANLGGVAWQGQDFGMISGDNVKLVHNFFGGAAVETVMFGGSIPHQNWPHNIEIRTNTFVKEFWGNPNNPCTGNNPGMANLLEFKGGSQRFIVQGNKFLYSPAAGSGSCYEQFGSAINLKIDQNGSDTAGWKPLSELSDGWIDSNDFGHIATPVVILGQDQLGKQYPASRRIRFSNNRWFDNNRATWGTPAWPYYSGLVMGGGGGSAQLQSFQVRNPGPWYVTFDYNGFYSTPNNTSGLTFFGKPKGCTNPGSSLPYFVFHANVSVGDGPTGTSAGHEILNGDCGQYPYQLFANGVFPNSDFGDGIPGAGHTGNVLFNFKAGTGTTCDQTTGSGGWGSVNPGRCPTGLASSPATINAALGTPSYTNCATGTGANAKPGGTYTDCFPSGTYAGVGPDYTVMLARMAFSDDHYANGTTLAVATTSLPLGHVASVYSASLAASGGTPPYSWAVTAGSLPSGLSLSSGGTISGTPTTVQTASFTITVIDSATPTPATASAALSIQIEYALLGISLSGCPDGEDGVVYPGCTPSNSGGNGTLAWSVVSGALPAGLSMDGSTGAITGTPSGSGTFGFTVRAVDTETPPQAATATGSVLIITGGGSLHIVTTTVPVGFQNSIYNATLTAAGGTAPYTWDVPIGFGGCPAGLVTIGSSSGQFTGTPTAHGSCTIGVRVRDSASHQALQQITILIKYPLLAIDTPTCSAGLVNTPYSCTLVATGGNGSTAWSLDSGALPDGISLNSTTGELAGTPTSAGDYPLTVQAQDSESPVQSDTDTATLSIAGGARHVKVNNVRVNNVRVN